MSRNALSLFARVLIPFSVCALATAAPRITISSVPPYGGFGPVQGQTFGVQPGAYQVALLINISGVGWFSKPFCNTAFTQALPISILPDGSWSTSYATGGVDETATQMAAFLLPANTTIPCYLAVDGVPSSLGAQAVASVLIDRPFPRQVVLSGLIFDVKTNKVAVGPGPCLYSDSTDNVWVDNLGRLHLKITNRNGQWYCAEVVSRVLAGYGSYKFTIDSPVSDLEPNVVLGLFTWSDDDASYAHREIDIEYSRFGQAADPTNGQFVVQPAPPMRFTFPSTDRSIHSFQWGPDDVLFSANIADGTVVSQWDDKAGIPPPGHENVRMNLWLFNGKAPAAETEVIISGIQYTPVPVATRFVPITPCRIADTRNPSGPFGGPSLGGGVSRDFAISNGVCNVPSKATAYSLNLSVVPRGSLGYATVWPSGQVQPLAATLTSVDGRIRSNAAIVPAGQNGAVSVYTTDPTDLVLDINGYFVPATDPSGLAFYPVTPCRIADTRGSNGSLGGPTLFAQSTRTFPVGQSPCGIPAGAQALSLNFAAVPKGPLGYLTAWPTGQPQPLAATLTAVTGTVTANAVIVPVGSNRSVDVYSTNDTDLVIDINGYFAPPGAGGLSFYNLPPCRVLDTRLPSVSPPFAGTRDVDVGNSACGAPTQAQAYVFNATVVPAGSFGYLTMWPQAQPLPLAATLNAVDGAITSNLAIVPSATGAVSAFASNATHLVLDIFGYFAP